MLTQYRHITTVTERPQVALLENVQVLLTKQSSPLGLLSQEGGGHRRVKNRLKATLILMPLNVFSLIRILVFISKIFC